MISGTEWLTHRGSGGRFIGDAKVKIVDAAGHELPPGEVGEVFIKAAAGPGSTYHYVGAEARTDGEWESLGDMGYLDVEGYLYLADRRTDLILRGGANIYPAEVEAAIDQHPSVASSVVIGLPILRLRGVYFAMVTLVLTEGLLVIGVSDLKFVAGYKKVEVKCVVHSRAIVNAIENTEGIAVIMQRNKFRSVEKTVRAIEIESNKITRFGVSGRKISFFLVGAKIANA